MRMGYVTFFAANRFSNNKPSRPGCLISVIKTSGSAWDNSDQAASPSEYLWISNRSARLRETRSSKAGSSSRQTSLSFLFSIKLDGGLDFTQAGSFKSLSLSISPRLFQACCQIQKLFTGLIEHTKALCLFRVPFVLALVSVSRPQLPFPCQP